MPDDISVLAYVIGAALAILAIVAQLRIFSVDRTLKAILAELKNRPESRSRPAA